MMANERIGGNMVSIHRLLTVLANKCVGALAANIGSEHPANMPYKGNGDPTGRSGPDRDCSKRSWRSPTCLMDRWRNRDGGR